jgi:hypothetical protein
MSSKIETPQIVQEGAGRGDACAGRHMTQIEVSYTEPIPDAPMRHAPPRSAADVAQ